jgi:hypothetical protein
MPTASDSGLSPAAKRRPLRSNAEELRIPISPAPAVLQNQFFTKDFGPFGVFVGACIGVRLRAHKYTGEDMYCVQYGTRGLDMTKEDRLAASSLQRKFFVCFFFLYVFFFAGEQMMATPRKCRFSRCSA